MQEIEAQNPGPGAFVVIGWIGGWQIRTRLGIGITWSQQVSPFNIGGAQRFCVRTIIHKDDRQPEGTAYKSVLLLSNGGS